MPGVWIHHTMRLFNKTIAVRAIASVMALVDLQTQVLCAGHPMWLGAPPGVDALGLQIKNASLNAAKTGLATFHSFAYSNTLDPRGKTDLPQQSQVSPENLAKDEQNQLDVLRQMEELDLFRDENQSVRPQLPGTTPNILDTVSTYKLNTNIAKELKAWFKRSDNKPKKTWTTTSISCAKRSKARAAR